MATEDVPIHQVPTGMWDTLAPAWDRHGDWHARVTRPLTEVMVDALAPASGDTVVEVACGPTADSAFEVVARMGPHCRVIASDLSSNMLEAARRRGTAAGIDIDFRVLDVTSLDFLDSTIDRVVGRWVYMLLDDPVAAFVEARRVLRPGGRLVFAVFADPAENPFFMVPAAVLLERGLIEAPRPGTPSIFALAQIDATTAMLRTAGFADITCEPVDLAYRLPGRDELRAYLTEFTGPLAMAISRLDPTTRDEVVAEIERRSQTFADGSGGYLLPGRALVFACR